MPTKMTYKQIKKLKVREASLVHEIKRKCGVKLQVNIFEGTEVVEKNLEGKDVTLIKVGFVTTKIKKINKIEKCLDKMNMAFVSKHHREPVYIDGKLRDEKEAGWLYVIRIDDKKMEVIP